MSLGSGRALALPDWLVAVLLGTTLAVVPGPPRHAFAGDAPVRGDGRIRLSGSDLGSDQLDVVARFDSGAALFASTVVHNFGWGDGHATALGYWMQPDGTLLRRMSRSEKHGHWTLSEDGAHMDLRAALIDRAGPLKRFFLRKDWIRVDLRSPATASPSWPPEPIAPGCGLDVLEVSAPVSGSWWREGMDDPMPLEGRVAWTQRWMDDLEVACALRRIEVFVLEPEIGLYYTEVLAPDGRVRRWWVATRGEQMLASGSPESSEVRWQADPKGYPHFQNLEVEDSGLLLRVTVEAPLPRIDPRPDMKQPFKSLVSMRTDPRLALGAGAFHLELARPDGEPERRTGTALVKIAHHRRLDDD